MLIGNRRHLPIGLIVQTVSVRFVPTGFNLQDVVDDTHVEIKSHVNLDLLVDLDFLKSVFFPAKFFQLILDLSN